MRIVFSFENAAGQYGRALSLLCVRAAIFNSVPPSWIEPRTEREMANVGNLISSTSLNTDRLNKSFLFRNSSLRFYFHSGCQHQCACSAALQRSWPKSSDLARKLNQSQVWPQQKMASSRQFRGPFENAGKMRSHCKPSGPYNNEQAWNREFRNVEVNAG